MHKFIKSLMLLVVCLCFTLTGCSLFERDNARYFSQTVAYTKEEKEVKVSMEDLLAGFNSWGYQYLKSEENPTGMEAKDAVEKTINDIIDKKYILRTFDEGFVLEDKEKWLAYKETYDYINEQIKGFEDKVRIEWKMDAGESEGEKEEIDETKIYKQYESKFKFDKDNNDNIVFNDIKEDETEYPTVAPVFYFSSIGALENADKDNKKVFVEAKSRFYNQLKKNFNDRGQKNLNDEQLLEKEVERVYKIQEENAKVAKFQKNFENVISRTPEKLDEILEAMYEKFKLNYLSQKQYYSNADNLEGYRKKMLDSANTEVMYYHPEQTSGEFFTVTHLLIKFSDEVTAELKTMKEAVTNGETTQESYDEFLKTKQQTLKVQAINPKTGKAEGDYKTPIEILNEVQATCPEAMSFEDGTKSEAFRNVQYKYQGDTAVYEATKDYVIPTDSSRDTMVKTFADMSRMLRGSSSEEHKSNLGKISGLVPSEFGYHIIMYTGEVANSVTSVNNKESVLKELFKTKLKADKNKTYFDALYESVSTTVATYNTYVENIVKTCRNGVDVKMYPNRYKDLYK